jgi:DeoR/GlpR family transcriptional regulator of sugar metabolism
MKQKKMRRAQILEYIEQHQHVGIDEICEAFSISTATARRDLDRLAEDAKVRRVHGGAVAIQNELTERGFRSRALEQEEEKERIGKAASELIEDGDTVFLGSGSTVVGVAYYLGDRRNLTVMTNCIPVMNMLKDVPEIRLIGIGGILQHSEQAYIGHITEQALAELQADKVITGIRAIDVEKGLMNNDPMCIQTERAILGVGQQVIVVADHTKCNSVDMAFVAPIDAIDILVTDSEVPPDFVSALTERGIQVVIA